MASSSSSSSQKIIFPFIFAFLVLVSSLGHVLSLPVLSDSGDHFVANQTFRSDKELQRLKRIRAYLRKINKPAVKKNQRDQETKTPLMQVQKAFRYGKILVNHAQKEPFQSEEQQKQMFCELIRSKTLEGN
ncbi:hypothetical protein U1Q18_027370 [Sarracenia purpurea var. burkii]